MPRQILFIQGGGEGVHDAWDNKLVRSLKHELGKGYTVRYPRMPDEADPRYPAWKTTLLAEIDQLADDAVLMGRSTGGAILARVLAEQWPTRRPGAVSLIAAPFIGEGGWPCACGVAGLDSQRVGHQHSEGVGTGRCPSQCSGVLAR